MAFAKISLLLFSNVVLLVISSFSWRIFNCVYMKITNTTATIIQFSSGPRGLFLLTLISWIAIYPVESVTAVSRKVVLQTRESLHDNVASYYG